MNTVSTETWSLQLPRDWIDASNEKTPGHYFTDPEETKGLYVKTWQVDLHGESSDVSIAEQFREKSLAHLFQMPESNWLVEAEELKQFDVYAWAMFDAYDEQRLYRIHSCTLAALPWVVQANFHDYYATSWTESLMENAGITDSITIIH